MKDSDSQMLFEVYRKIYEAPVDPGGSWGDEDVSSKFDKDEMERLSKYKVGDADTVNKVVDAVKNFLAQHENSHYDGTYKEFRAEIVDVVRDAAGIGRANAGYVARVVQNALKRLDVITIDGATQEVEVSVVPEPEVDKVVGDKVEKVLRVQPGVRYEIGAASNSTPGSEPDKAFNLLKKGIGSGFSATGKDIISVLIREMPLASAKFVANELLKVDGIMLPEVEDDAEDRVVDVGGEIGGDSRHDAQDYFDKHMGYGLGSGSMD
jgi:hypothetical protein